MHAKGKVLKSFEWKSLELTTATSGTAAVCIKRKRVVFFVREL